MMTSVCIKSTVGLLCGGTRRPCQGSVLVWQNIARSITTVGPVNQKVQMTRMLEKMLKKGGKKKWSGAHTSVFADIDGNERHQAFKVTEGNRRRAEQVGKVLYDNIVSLVNSGELHPGLVENSVEIATVKMAVDFSGINVYWYATGKESDAHTQSLLDSNAGKLREMLISLRIIGNVPKIIFVQDMTQAKVAELDRLLKIADMGPSEEETNHTEHQEPGQIDSNEQLITNTVQDYSASMLNRDFQKMAEKCDTSLQNPQSLVGLNRKQLQSEAAKENCMYNNNIREDNSEKNHLKEHGSTSSHDGSNPNIPFRYDVYSLNREELVNKVIALKNKARHRTVETIEGLAYPSFSAFKSDGKSKKLPPPKLSKLKKYSMADYLTENQEKFSPTEQSEDYINVFDDENVDVGSDSEGRK